MIKVNNSEIFKKICERLNKLGVKKTSIIGLALIIMLTNCGSVKKQIKSVSSENKKYSLEQMQERILRLATSYSFLEEAMKEAEEKESKELTNDDKIAIILEQDGLTLEQFDEIVATVYGEAAANSYEDAYAVINTFYNRTLSKKWVYEVLKVTGEDNGNNIYQQITLVNQSSVYTSGLYKKYLGIKEGPIYQAVIDFLYSLESMHDYLSFYASFGDISNSEQFVEKGNLYYSELEESDRIEKQMTLTREK